jgi:hypothetical protein
VTKNSFENNKVVKKCGLFYSTIGPYKEIKIIELTGRVIKCFWRNMV